jgi:hypothetical protein
MRRACGCDVIDYRRLLNGGASRYDIMLTAMRSKFAHARESKAVSVAAYQKLNSAIGRGLDVNDEQMQRWQRSGSPRPHEDLRISRTSSMVRADVLTC